MTVTLQNARLYNFLARDPLASEASALALATHARRMFDLLRSRVPLHAKEAAMMEERLRFNVELKTAASFCLLPLPPELNSQPEEASHDHRLGSDRTDDDHG